MTRPRLTTLVLALVFTFALPAAPGFQPGPLLSPGAGSFLGPASAAAQGIMECMRKCIQHEGGNTATNKATCKSRCAGAPQAGAQGGGPDCMTVHKTCIRGCGKNKNCKRACRKRLLNCK